MDGVLVNFNANIPQYALSTNRPSEKLNTNTRLLKNRMWHEIENTPDFWHNLPINDDIQIVLDAATNIGELFVLSKTPGADHFVNADKYVEFVANEKRDWIQRNLANYFDKTHVIICTGAKGKLISPSSFDILVDDRIDNIDEWHNAGGRCVHFTSAKDALYSISHEKFK